MTEVLRMDLMMYGRVRRSRYLYDQNGDKIIEKYSKNNKPVYKREKYWVTLSEENGDQGIYPSVNQIYVRKGKKVCYTEPAEILFSKWQAQTSLWCMQNNWEPTAEKIYLDYTFYMPNDNRTRDTHNVLKMNIDSMKSLVFIDDNTVLPRIMDYQKCGDDKPHIDVRIWTKAEHDEFMEKLLKSYDKKR